MNKHRFNYLVLGGMALLRALAIIARVTYWNLNFILKIGNMYSRWKMKVG